MAQYQNAQYQQQLAAWNYYQQQNQARQNSNSSAGRGHHPAQQQRYQQQKSQHPSLQGDALEAQIQGQSKPKTDLITLVTNDPEKAPKMITKSNKYGVPIMVMVDPPSCCYCKLNVPEGVTTLEENCGKHSGMMEPGCYCCVCACRKISTMISMNTIRFDAPVKNCPTKDNVLVTIDIGVTFHIGNKEDDDQRELDCKNFLYFLGPARLEELLEAESEEAIRNFIRKVKAVRVRDVKSELTTEMKAEMSKKFQEFGVYIEHVVIMNVKIPGELRLSLMNTTSFDVHLQNHIKRFGKKDSLIQLENSILKQKNIENKKIATLNREHQRTLVDMNHQKEVEEIDLEEKKIRAYTNQQVQSIEAERINVVKIIQAEAQKEAVENATKKEVSVILADAQAENEKKMIEAEYQSNIIMMEAEARLAAATQRSEALIKEARAEGQAQAALEYKRKHDEMLMQTDVLSRIAQTSSMVVSGKNGEQLLKYFRGSLKSNAKKEQ